MGDHNGASGEVQKGLFKGPQSGYVQVVTRLVQQQQVSALVQQLGQVDAVSFAPGKLPDLLLLILAGEVETSCVGAGVHRLVAEAFLPAPSDPSWTEVHHRDSKRSNCDADNLFWGPRTTDNHTLRVAESAAASAAAPVTPIPSQLYQRCHTKDGLLNPFAWSLEIRASRGGGTYVPEWFLYFTAFNCEDLVQDLGIEHSPHTVHHEEWKHDIKHAGGHDFNCDRVKRAQIEVGPVSDSLLWTPLHTNSSSSGIQVSLCGLIRDPELRTIGSGQISLQHARHKVYYPGPSVLQNGPTISTSYRSRRPAWLVESMVLTAWLGENHHECFLGPNVHHDSTDDTTTVYHVDGNIHHNHLFNLLVIPKQDCLDHQQLLSILERIEPFWKWIEAHATVSTPRMTSNYARSVLNRHIISSP